MFIDWDNLTATQQKEVLAVYTDHADMWRFAFWVKKDGHMSRKKGHHDMSKRGQAAIDAMLKGTSVRSKGDLREWKPGTTFHFSQG